MLSLYNLFFVSNTLTEKKYFFQKKVKIFKLYKKICYVTLNRVILTILCQRAISSLFFILISKYRSFYNATGFASEKYYTFCRPRCKIAMRQFMFDWIWHVNFISDFVIVWSISGHIRVLYRLYNTRNYKVSCNRPTDDQLSGWHDVFSRLIFSIIDPLTASILYFLNNYPPRNQLVKLGLHT